MEGSRFGILGRLFEKVLTWVVLALLIGLGIVLYTLGASGRQALMDGLWKTCVWCVVAAALPWSFQLFISRILEIGANWAGLVVLAAFLLVDVVAGVWLLGGAPHGVWLWIATLAVLAMVGTYNLLVTEYLSEQAGI